MSKRNKRKNKHKFQSSKKEEGQSQGGSVEAKSVTLDEKIDDLALQSIKAPGTGMAETTITKANDVTSAEVQKGGKKSRKTTKAFIWGIILGAFIVSIFF